MKKITLATLKAFIRKNIGGLYAKKTSDFDGMVDCVMPVNMEFAPVDPMKVDLTKNNDFGINNIWVVGSSNDYITAYDVDEYSGFNISNCCGNYIIAIKK